MRNLLSANFFRLRRNLVFWVCMTGMLIGSAGFMVLWCLENAGPGVFLDPDAYWTRLAPMVSLLCGVFACLFLNAEYAEGTVRNKLAVGHTRRDIYLSHFVTVFAASAGIALAWLIGNCASVPFLGLPAMPPAQLALCGVVILGYTAAFSAIFTCIGMLNNRRSATVITLLVWLAMLLMASSLDAALYEPEFKETAKVTIDGVQAVLTEPNPFYISGIQRVVYEFLIDLLPSGQAARLQNFRLDGFIRMMLCDLGVTAALTGIGLRRFRRKDLK